MILVNRVEFDRQNTTSEVGVTQGHPRVLGYRYKNDSDILGQAELSAYRQGFAYYARSQSLKHLTDATTRIENTAK